MPKQYRSEYMKEYRLAHKDHIKDLLKNHRARNGDMLRKKYQCEECDGKFTYEHKARHFKSKKHLKAINALQQN